MTFCPLFTENNKQLKVYPNKGIPIPCTVQLYSQLHPSLPLGCLFWMEAPESWFLKTCVLGSTCKTGRVRLRRSCANSNRVRP